MTQIKMMSTYAMTIITDPTTDTMYIWFVFASFWRGSSVSGGVVELNGGFASTSAKQM